MNISNIYRYTIGALFALLAVFVSTGQASKHITTYDSPDSAAAALAEAAKSDSIKELYKILGAKAKPMLESGDPVTDGEERAAFTAAYEKKHQVKPDAKHNGRYLLEIGENAWPFPVPIVQENKSGRWFFDAEAGLDTLFSRRIGQNELAAIQVCLAYVDAQNEYYKTNPEKSAKAHFASKLASSPGKRDGLYWESAEGEEPSPLGELMAAAEKAGYHKSKQGAKTPYHGYYYKIISRQGSNASSGAKDYIKDGKMSEGFALLAYPANYGVSGIMSFMVNQEGLVYEKDLGKKSSDNAEKIDSFDPDKSWVKTEE